MDLRELKKYPRSIVCDCDGVLTNGKFWVSSSGECSKGFHTRDVRAIRELISHGFDFIIVTASSWPGMDSFSEKTGASVIITRDKSDIKVGGDGRYIGIGDDAWDIKMLKKADMKFCPSDAVNSVKSISGINILKIKGGEGVILELALTLLPQLS